MMKYGLIDRIDHGDNWIDFSREKDSTYEVWMIHKQTGIRMLLFKVSDSLPYRILSEIIQKALAE